MRMKKTLILMLAAGFVLGAFLMSVWNAEQTAGERGREQLENALRQASVACYAAEGVYPPNPGYLQEHYGLLLDEERYMVFYESFADNLMPIITVLEREA